MVPDQSQETPRQRYLRVVREVLDQRGRHCECCGIPARHIHHINPCSPKSIHSELYYAPENMMVICNDCHLLMHPLIRRPSWKRAAKAQGTSLQCANTKGDGQEMSRVEKPSGRPRKGRSK
jgi:5-methylcytosine-specific restriction endonuclease McrA